MRGHTFSDHSFHSGKTNPVLVLQQFAHRTDTAVAKMINIVIIAKTVLQMHIIINGSNNIFLRNVLGNQLMDILLNCIRKRFGIFRIFFQKLRQNRIIYQFRNAQFFGIAVYKMGNIHHHIGKNLHISFLCLNVHKGNRSILNRISQLCGYFCSFFRQYLACQSVYDIL